MACLIDINTKMIWLSDYNQMINEVYDIEFVRVHPFPKALARISLDKIPRNVQSIN